MCKYNKQKRDIETRTMANVFGERLACKLVTCYNTFLVIVIYLKIKNSSMSFPSKSWNQINLRPSFPNVHWPSYKALTYHRAISPHLSLSLALNVRRDLPRVWEAGRRRVRSSPIPMPLAPLISSPLFFRRAYCSDTCQSKDSSSPSISSASSTFSSPYLGYTPGGDVPALIPSALGAALNSYRHDPYSVSSSSASSTSWSLLTDQEEDESVLGTESDNHEAPDSLYETSTKPAGYLHPIHPSGLSYARRPSGTNNRSTVPLLHRRTSSSSDAGHVHVVPQSAPIHSHTSSDHFFARDDESYNSDVGGVPPDRPRRSGDRRRKEKDSALTAKVKRQRNRASLPAYFSLLQMSGSSNSSLTPTAAPTRLSPPTPKSSLAVCLPHSCAPVQATPRGRCREAGTSQSSRRTRSRSRSPSRPAYLKTHLRDIQAVEQAFDSPYVHVPRGRTTRRNSSPPQRMALSGGIGPDSRRGRGEFGDLGGSMSPAFGKKAVNWGPVGSGAILKWP